jgi:phage gp36-like protein
MPGPTVYCSLADVLALVSLDAQARMATDAERPVSLGVSPFGGQQLWETPFYDATEILAYVNRVQDMGATLVYGGGPNGTDRINLSAPAPAGAVVTAAGDLKSVNTAVVQQCIVLAAGKIKGSLARYGTENLPADVVAVLQPLNVFYTRWFLRMRRSMNEWDPIIEEFKSNERTLLNFATGKMALPASAPIATAAPPSPVPIHSEPNVFGPPYTNTPDNDRNLF